MSELFRIVDVSNDATLIAVRLSAGDYDNALELNRLRNQAITGRLALLGHYKIEKTSNIQVELFFEGSALDQPIWLP